MYDMAFSVNYIVTCWAGNTSNNLRILDYMPDLLVMRQVELQSIITIAVSLQSLLKSSQLITTLNLTGIHCTLC
jgi:hypothetical protein